MFNPIAQRVPLLLFLASHLTVSVVSRSFTIENNCKYTIWPATVTYNYDGTIDPTGFMLEKGETRIINATSSWIGNLWGRTQCSTSSTGLFSCITGDCDTRDLECSGTVAPTATLAEFNLAYDGGDDYYDVNVMNGYNLPLLVTPENGKCKSIGCVVDIKKTCPKELWINNRTDIRSNEPYACKTSCQKNQSRELCCVRPYIGEGVPPRECKRTIYSETFNRACPGAYSYAYDTINSTFTCPSPSNYVIQFCPSGPDKFTRSTKRSSTAVPPLAPSVSPASKKTQAGEKRKSLLKLKLILGGSAFFAMIIIIAIVIKVRANNRRKSDWNGKNIESVVMLKRFSYVQVKKMTKSFADVLGRGGFGTVYKGKLPDGSRDVAVKILKDSDENGEDFINEVLDESFGVLEMIRAQKEQKDTSIDRFIYRGKTNRSIQESREQNGKVIDRSESKIDRCGEDMDMHRSIHLYEKNESIDWYSLCHFSCAGRVWWIKWPNFLYLF